MKRVHKSEDGFYYVKGKKYKDLVGSREKVWNENAYKTPGGLTRDQLVMNKRGRIVSKSKYYTSKKEMRLQKHGYFARKGKFGYVKRKTKRKSKNGKTTKKRKTHKK
jgi:hypothetical protein